MKILQIHHFGPIKDVKILLKDYNFFIGGQGVGKSTLAKLLSIVSDYNLYLRLFKTESILVWNEFLKDYDILDYVHPDTLIEYNEKGSFSVYGQDEEYSLTLRVDKDVIHIEIICGDKRLETYEEYIEFMAKIVMKRVDPDELRMSENSDNRYKFMLELFRVSLYVPAERIMYSSFNKLLPALNLVNESISKNLLYFSVDYSNAKSWKTHSSVPVLGVDFVHDKDEDYIVTDNGKKLLLKSASSGMQSCIPLLLTLDYATEKKHYYSYVIEEPECNLFPENQLRLMDVILQYIHRTTCSLTITTHSPYVINYLNLLVRRYYRGKDGINPDLLTAYYVSEDGGVLDLMSIDNKTNEVVVNTIDLSETMANIFSEYSSLK
jgi:predicted ATPase